MNLHTHAMVGILVGALFFGRPEIMLMIGVGVTLPDLDRECGFFSKEAFQRIARKSYSLFNTRVICEEEKSRAK